MKKRGARDLREVQLRQIPYAAHSKTERNFGSEEKQMALTKVSGPNVTLSSIDE